VSEPRVPICGLVRVLVEGTPDEIKSNAAVQEAYLGGVHEA
jgi:branched-chain amino acid transport system permease protein